MPFGKGSVADMFELDKTTLADPKSCPNIGDHLSILFLGVLILAGCVLKEQNNGYII